MCIYYYLLFVCVLFSILVRTLRFSPVSSCGLFIVCCLCLCDCCAAAAVVASLYLLLSFRRFLKLFEILEHRI